MLLAGLTASCYSTPGSCWSCITAKPLWSGERQATTYRKTSRHSGANAQHGTCYSPWFQSALQSMSSSCSSLLSAWLMSCTLQRGGLDMHMFSMQCVYALDWYAAATLPLRQNVRLCRHGAATSFKVKMSCLYEFTRFQLRSGMQLLFTSRSLSRFGCPLQRSVSSSLRPSTRAVARTGACAQAA